MELHLDTFALTISAGTIEVPYGSMDEILFLQVKKELLERLKDRTTEVVHFGYSPDNTADAQDELLTDGVFYRIIGYEKNLGVDFNSSPEKQKNAFANLIETYNPYGCTIIVEEGVRKKEVTIEVVFGEGD